MVLGLNTGRQLEDVVNRLICTMIVGIFAATPQAGAADIFYDSTPVKDWTGFYVGVIGGYGSGQAVTDTTGVSTTIPLNGLIAGVTVGANKQIDKMVLGLEGDLAWSGQSGSATCVLDPRFACNGDLDWIGSVRGRVGYSVDSALFYATAGAAFMRGNATITPSALATSIGLSGSHSDSYLGWTVGAGVEYALNDAFSVKAEYNYANYGARTAPAMTLAGPATTVNVTSHIAKLGLNFHF